MTSSSACGAVALFALMAPVASWSSTPWIFANGFEDCEIDSDQDRLADCDEVARGTLPKRADTDADGLTDGDEVLGTVAGLDLPALGVDPLRKDLLLEIDWTADSRGCATHSHAPPVSVVSEVQTILAGAPIPNPDGSSGIRLFADVDDQVPLPLGMAPAPDSQAFDAFRAQHSDPNRLGYFHYQIHAHAFEGGGQSSGSSEIGGDDTVVTLQCHTDRLDWWRNTMLHELGHNFGLRHGGADDCNYKPNYDSLMNYAYQLHGIDVDCDTTPDGAAFIAFSRGDRIPLDPAALLEPDGVCGAAHPSARPIDWNANGIIDAAPVSASIACASPGHPVTDLDDFAAITLASTLPQHGQPILDSVTCQELP